MRIYYERTMICDCGQTQIQTATRLPLDWIGKALDETQRRDFSIKHRCNKAVRYTFWKMGRDCLEQNLTEPQEEAVNEQMLDKNLKIEYKRQYANGQSILTFNQALFGAYGFESRLPFQFYGKNNVSED